MNIILEPSIRHSVILPAAERQCLHERAQLPLLFLQIAYIHVFIHRYNYSNA